MAPAAATSAISSITMFVKYNASVRHAMMVFLLMAFIAGVFWELTGQKQIWGRLLLVLMPGVAVCFQLQDWI